VVGNPRNPQSRIQPTAKRAIVARQPICGPTSGVSAYEILYRNGPIERAAFSDGDQATAGVLSNVFLDIGLEQLVGVKPAFLNVTREFLLSDYCSMLPKERVVLEILEDVKPDEQIIQAITNLRKSGYAIALDDFHYSDDKRPLLELTDYVKVDFRVETPETLVQQLAILKKFNVKLVAEKVETQEEFELSKKLGFDYFQGYFFCRPKPVSVARLPLNKLSALRLAARLQDPNVTLAELERLVSQDVTLSFKLLRYLNSALLHLTSRIESVGHAVQMIGTRRIRAWASIIVLTGLDDKPKELVVTAMARGTMAERLATELKTLKPESCFTIGLFSVLDALLDLPMSKALELLPLADDVKQALVDRQGPMGLILECILAYENGIWSQVNCNGLDLETISQAYLASIAETNELLNTLD
jgi:EAL and modified HD-GYP domain-containing signal transduction protein